MVVKLNISAIYKSIILILFSASSFGIYLQVLEKRNSNPTTRRTPTEIVGFRVISVELGNISREHVDSMEKIRVSILGLWGVSAEVVSGAGDVPLGVSLFRDSARKDKGGK